MESLENTAGRHSKRDVVSFQISPSPSTFIVPYLSFHTLQIVIQSVAALGMKAHRWRKSAGWLPFFSTSFNVTYYSGVGARGAKECLIWVNVSTMSSVRFGAQHNTTWVSVKYFE